MKQVGESWREESTEMTNIWEPEFMSLQLLSKKALFIQRWKKINRKINILSFYAAHTQIKIIKTHLSASCANLTKHKWTVLFYYCGSMEEG